MSTTLSTSSGIAYGVARVCRVWGIPRSSYYDWLKHESIPFEERPKRSRPGPTPAISDEELESSIREIFERIEEDAGITGEGHRKVRFRLRQIGIHVSKERALRVMRENGLLAPTRTARARGPRVHEGTIITDLPDEMWGTDATTIATAQDGNIWVFAATDHCTGECVGIHCAIRGTRFEALVPIQEAILARFGSVQTGAAVGLSVRHDHGTQYMSKHFQSELRFLGVESSPSFVRQPQGNGVAERFFKTLKEQLLHVRTFDGVDDLYEALKLFQQRYNNAWLVAKHKYKTPNQVRASLTPEAA